MFKKRSHKLFLISFMICISLLLFYFIDTNNKAKSIFESKYEFEYGEIIEFNSDVPVSYDKDNLVFIDDNPFPEVGTYTVSLTYEYANRYWTTQVKIIIQDTTIPEVIIKDAQHTFYIGDAMDVSLLLEIHDLSDYAIDVDESSFNMDKKGSYEVIVSVIDTYDNITEVQIPITVLEKEVVNDKPSPTQPKPNAIKDATYREGHVIVNKKHGLPDNFASGEDPVAAGKVLELINEMKSQGMSVDGSYAGYRTWDLQNTLYTNYIKQHGQEAADISSAKPGYSEHQTGLTFDLRSPNGSLLQTQPEVDWVANNAHRFGFIVRYPEGKTHVTGYKYEPWHLRYMGKDAEKIYNSSLSLEEYYNIEG